MRHTLINYFIYILIQLYLSFGFILSYGLWFTKFSRDNVHIKTSTFGIELRPAALYITMANTMRNGVYTRTINGYIYNVELMHVRLEHTQQLRNLSILKYTPCKNIIIHFLGMFNLICIALHALFPSTRHADMLYNIIFEQSSIVL